MATVVTGIKPSGTPHLGNYFGMIEPALALAGSHDADLVPVGQDNRQHVDGE